MSVANNLCEMAHCGRSLRIRKLLTSQQGTYKRGRLNWQQGKGTVWIFEQGGFTLSVFGRAPDYDGESSSSGPRA
ncbi:Hypothetical predicted protein [Podarcis lilfordi]|uniref:Uncharacterized protein n=1 Tax=Podarcis lilfordi TaxID=74358 RepID=A0AA35NYW0_9SAUR|nr:Hypothetical predicted protein [Podarcis lilfordi]